MTNKRKNWKRRR